MGERIEAADRDIEDGAVADLLDSAVGEDGGQWNMFVAIVKKHGLVPKSFMPETNSSSNTGRMNSVLRSLLRQGAKSIRATATGEGGASAARAEKAELLPGTHRGLGVHLGHPHARSDWHC